MKIAGFFEAALALGGCVSLFIFAVAAAGAAPEWQCKPTPTDALGPFYQADAPLRSRVGQGRAHVDQLQSFAGAVGEGDLGGGLRGVDLALNEGDGRQTRARVG